MDRHWPVLQCKTHYTKTNKLIVHFNGCWIRMKPAHSSGESDDQVMKRAHAIATTQGTLFIHLLAPPLSLFIQKSLSMVAFSLLLPCSTAQAPAFSNEAIGAPASRTDTLWSYHLIVSLSLFHVASEPMWLCEAVVQAGALAWSYRSIGWSSNCMVGDELCCVAMDRLVFVGMLR